MNNEEEEQNGVRRAIEIPQLNIEWARLENEENEQDIQDESEPLIFSHIYPYKKILPVPEETAEVISGKVILDCLVCKVNMINTVTFPCRHASLCVSCSREYGKIQNVCPVCRTPLEAIERLYISYSEETKKKRVKKMKSVKKRKGIKQG